MMLKKTLLAAAALAFIAIGATAPASAPRSRYGRRLPRREWVLSESAPKMGLLMSATTAPAKSTRETERVAS